MQPIKLVFLGTGGSAPSKDRSTPSLYLEYEGNRLLFDCGEAVQRQLLLAGKSPLSLDAIFITHLHGDHVFGLPGLLNTMELNNRQRPLYIFAPSSALPRLKRLVHAIPFTPSFPLVWKNVKGEEVIFEGKLFRVRSLPLDHTVETYGYIFEEKDRRRLIKEKLDILGIKDWKVYRKLKAGESVRIGERILTPEEFTYVVKGRKIAYLVDTRKINPPRVDYLIADATFLSSEEEKARETGHMTVREAAEMAKEAGAKKLFLFHISSRYRKPEEIIREAKDIFENVHLPSDLDEVVLT